MCDYQTIQKTPKTSSGTSTPPKTPSETSKMTSKNIQNIKDNMRNTKVGVNNTEQEPSCDATLLEFRRTVRFLTGTGVLDHVF